MEIKLTPQLEAALTEQALRRGVSQEALVIKVLQERFLPKVSMIDPGDEWERTLFAAAIDCGVSVPNSALSSDGLYE